MQSERGARPVATLARLRKPGIPTALKTLTTISFTTHGRGGASLCVLGNADRTVSRKWGAVGIKLTVNVKVT